MILFELFISFFKIGLFSIGGGYAAMPLIQEQVVTLHHWLTMAQFGDIVTIAEMTPGPIAVNAATFVGTQVAGLKGAIIATLGCITPSCVIVISLAYIYHHYRSLGLIQGILSGLRPAVVGMIASAAISLLVLALNVSNTLSTIDLIATSIFAVALIILRKYKTSPILIIFASGFVGLLLYMFL